MERGPQYDIWQYNFVRGTIKMTMIYTNSAERRVYLEVPVEPESGSLEAEVVLDRVVVHTPTVISQDERGYYFNMPFSLVQSDADYDVRWRFNYVEDGQYYEYNNTVKVSVVTPILELSEIERILGDDFSDQEIADIERAVRHIIQAHTGQFFGRLTAKKRVSGSGENYLRLPMRLIRLKTVNGNTFWNDSLALRGAGWYLQSKSFGVPTVRADYHGWHQSAWGYSNKAPIVAPYSKNMFAFVEHAEYEIDGVWGWEKVPEAVKEAARLLVNDYACADSMYRDRFLTSMTAADWRIQFHEGAFSNTGNVRANQLLAEFVLRRGWVVV